MPGSSPAPPAPKPSTRSTARASAAQTTSTRSWTAPRTSCSAPSPPPPRSTRKGAGRRGASRKNGVPPPPWPGHGARWGVAPPERLAASVRCFVAPRVCLARTVIPWGPRGPGCRSAGLSMAWLGRGVQKPAPPSPPPPLSIGGAYRCKEVSLQSVQCICDACLHEDVPGKGGHHDGWISHARLHRILSRRSPPAGYSFGYSARQTVLQTVLSASMLARFVPDRLC